MLYETEKEIERVILVGIDTGDNEFDAESCQVPKLSVGLYKKERL